MIYKTHFGKEISRKEAYEQSTKLIRLIQLTYKPIAENEYKQLQKRRQETKTLIL